MIIDHTVSYWISGNIMVTINVLDKYDNNQDNLDQRYQKNYYIIHSVKLLFCSNTAIICRIKWIQLRVNISTVVVSTSQVSHTFIVPVTVPFMIITFVLDFAAAFHTKTLTWTFLREWKKQFIIKLYDTDF